jgi:rubrerythrin
MSDADADAPRPAARPITPLKSALDTPPATADKTLCERCGAEMYRVHAVWRCPACGFKTDCCGW